MKALLSTLILFMSLNSFAEMSSTDLVKLQRKIYKMNWAETELMANADIRQMKNKVQYSRKQLLQEVIQDDRELESMYEDCAQAYKALQNDSSNGKKQELYLTKCLEINAYMILKTKAEKQHEKVYGKWSDLATELEFAQYELHKVLEAKKAAQFKALITQLQEQRE
ncbi:hypothetical protein LNTAR_00895 [Lentisphaera araneosa HTCC2155]|uniref:Uncharacterized protein n=1 Tax=Lentisphaera araneosa HTCC2155 TaxID=313628 RepID=A6DKL6_9BACT|nr:hypothetical protein [Lentisphaera araneosa]EDM27914.1 hypothetical protein LNTAR_00895 [Lentisphaera araneosa HTCC2155]